MAYSLYRNMTNFKWCNSLSSGSGNRIVMERQNQDINQRFTVLLNVQDAKMPFRNLNLYMWSIEQWNINKSYARWNL